MLLSCVFMACGEDTSGPDIVVPPKNNTSPNMVAGNTSPNATPNNTTPGNNTTPANNTTPGNNTTPANNISPNNTSPANNTTACTGEDCDNFSVFGECNFVNDQGSLVPMEGGAVVRFEGSTKGLDSDIASSCAADGDTSAEYVWSFVPSEASFATISIVDDGGIDWVISTRRGECEPEKELVCRDSGLIDYLAAKDERQFIVAEPVAGSQKGDIAIQVSLEPAVCSDLGSQTCDMDSLKVCEGGTMETLYACGTSCSMDACDGDVCASAPVLGGSSTYEFEGTMRAYTDTFNAIDVPSCSLDGVLKTPGADQIFSVPGLSPGQKITIEANDPSDANDNAIFIMKGCGAMAECVAVDELADELTWTVDEGGDYTIVIDSISNINKEFKHTITID